MKVHTETPVTRETCDTLISKQSAGPDPYTDCEQKQLLMIIIALSDVVPKYYLEPFTGLFHDRPTVMPLATWLENVLSVENGMLRRILAKRHKNMITHKEPAEVRAASLNAAEEVPKAIAERKSQLLRLLTLDPTTVTWHDLTCEPWRTVSPIVASKIMQALYPTTQHVVLTIKMLQWAYYMPRTAMPTDIAYDIPASTPTTIEYYQAIEYRVRRLQLMHYPGLSATTVQSLIEV